MKQKTAVCTKAIVTVSAILISGVTSLATTVTLPAVNSGYYNFYGQSSQSMRQQGNIGLVGSLYHNWLAFDLGLIDGQILGATLQIYSSAKNVSGQQVTWYDVSTPYGLLGGSDLALGKAIFADMGTGQVFGQGTHTAGGLNSFVLSPAALASLNASESIWTIAGSTPPPTMVDNGYNNAFGYTYGVNEKPAYTMQLVLDVAPSTTRETVVGVPEAGWTLGMLAVGIAGLLALRPRTAKAS